MANIEQQTAALAALALLAAAWQAQPVAAAAAEPPASDGGAFGQWIDSDAGGMPAFDYTLDQTSPAGAKVARAYHDAERQTDWRDPTDNLFELGNDRLVGKPRPVHTARRCVWRPQGLASSLTEIACVCVRVNQSRHHAVVASTFGYVQVRQDELGPKFLQDVEPSSHQYGGGIVYVVDSETRELLATSWYTGQPGSRRRFGIGYMSVAQNASSSSAQQQRTAAAPAPAGSSEGACRFSRALGCFNDTDCPSCSAGPVLPVHQPQLHDKVTLPACASACHALSYAVAGVDGGNHCFCGNASDLSSAGAKARARPAGECQTSACHADPSEKCGGAGRLLAYSFVCDGPAPAPPAPPPPAPPAPPAEHSIGLQHELFVPFGDDPVVLSTVDVVNSAAKARNVSVITVWGTQMYQLQQCQETGGSCTSEQRRAFQRSHYTTATRLFYGPHDPDHAVSATTAASNVSSVQPTHWDATPPETFLSAVPSSSAAAAAGAAGAAGASGSVTFGCDAAAFYGAGGAASPAAKVTCDPSGASDNDNGAMILEKAVLLPAGGNVTLHSVYGYAPSGFFVDKLIEKYGTAEAVTAARAGLGPAWVASTMVRKRVFLRHLYILK